MCSKAVILGGSVHRKVFGKSLLENLCSVRRPRFTYEFLLLRIKAVEGFLMDSSCYTPLLMVRETQQYELQ